MAKVQTMSGMVHLSKNVRLGKSIVQAPACMGTRNLHYASPVSDEHPITCVRCQAREAQVSK